MLFSRIITAVVLLLSVTIINAQQKSDSTKQQHLHQLKTFWSRIPQPIGFVNDFEHLFTASQIQEIDSLLTDYDKRMNAQIALVTLDTSMTNKETLDELALKIGNEWGVGYKGKNNGIVICVSHGCRKMRIQTGFGMQKILPDEEVKQIIDSYFIPEYKNNNYFNGTLRGIKVLMAVIEDKLAEH